MTAWLPQSPLTAPNGNPLRPPGEGVCELLHNISLRWGRETWVPQEWSGVLPFRSAADPHFIESGSRNSGFGALESSVVSAGLDAAAGAGVGCAQHLDPVEGCSDRSIGSGGVASHDDP